VAFESAAANLVAGDTNGQTDIFVKDRDSSEISRVSVDSAGGQANASSFDASLSADGRFVAFESSSTNLVPGDTNGVADTFLHDRVTGETTRVSVDSLGGEADAFSRDPCISGNGRYVVFESWAANLVAGDTNGRPDVFLHDRVTGETVRISPNASVSTSTGTVATGGALIADC
jgi:Tol biopolymer transport system component